MSNRHTKETEQRIAKLKKQGLTSRRIAEDIFGKESMKSTVNNIWNRVKHLYDKEEEPVQVEDITETQLDELCESSDWDISNLAKRLRTAQKTNNQLRKIHRGTIDSTEHFEDMLNGITKAVKNLNVKPLDLKRVLSNRGDKACTVEILFSDFQIGKIGQYYNSKLAEKAIIRYSEQVMHNILSKEGDYRYEKIVLSFLGDLVEDHLKHGVQSAMATDSGLSEQIANATALIWEHVIKPLGSLGIPMEVICIAGNHGSSQHKGMDMYKAGLFSYDYPIYKSQEALCKEAGFKHIDFIIPEGVFGYTEIFGRTAVYEHGYFNSSTEKSMEDQMKKRGQQMKRHVEYFRCGDMHHVCSYDCHKMVLNGAFFGADYDGIEYSGIIGFNSTPAQVMMFHTPEKSIGRNTVKEFITIQVADGY